MGQTEEVWLWIGQVAHQRHIPGGLCLLEGRLSQSQQCFIFLNVKTQIQNILLKHTITSQFNEGIFHNISFIFSFVGQLEVLSGRVHLLCYFNDESASLCIYEYACVGEGDNREGIFKPRVIKLTLLYRISNSLYLLSFNRMFLYALCM